MTRTTFLIAFLAIAAAPPARAFEAVEPPEAPPVVADHGDAPEVEEALEAQSAEIDEVRAHAREQAPKLWERMAQL